jgi:formate hydrogenlyase subunit 3/multisubunit Na+/H+ antiporter MnhD subunit
VTLLVAALGTLVGGGALALAAWRSMALASALGAASAFVGCALGEVYALRTLIEGGPGGALALRWQVPYGWLRIGADALSAFFLVPIFGLGALAALYGAGYLTTSRRERALGPAWLAYNWLLASMALVVVARQAVLFLVAWEVMSLCSYVCVTLDREETDVARAGWVYLIASHIAAAILIALFLVFGGQAHGFDFESLRAASPAAPVLALLGLLALTGFGIKAGFVPLHVWLPEAHASAPSHVSALMSGVLIKMGLYGVLRMLLLFDAPPPWIFGPLLVVVGLAGATTGIALASYQRDIKRVLAYSSIENMGLIVLAVGVAVWGARSGHPRVAALAMAAALLHTWNHSLMKGLMFLAAGSVMHGSGTRDLERLGGILQRMPRTGLLMLLGSLAIAGLPPLNGFVSEWLLYLALAHTGIATAGAISVFALFAVGIVSLVGALAGLAFVRLVGTTLLGQARSESASRAHESPALMVVPMAVLALSCVALGLFPRPVLGAVSGVADELLRSPGALYAADVPLRTLARFNGAVWGLVALGACAAAFAIRRGQVARDSTWGCGYAQPTARMQYTASAFSELLSQVLVPSRLRPRLSVSRPVSLFPGPSAFTADCSDPMTRGFYEPFLARWADRFARLRWMQQGLLHVYLVYILVALLIGLAWSSLSSWSQG